MDKSMKKVFYDDLEVIGWANRITNKVACLSCAARRVGLTGLTPKKLHYMPIYEDFHPDDPYDEVICSFCKNVIVEALDNKVKK